MKKKLFLFALAATAVCSVLLTLFRDFLPEIFTAVASFPLEQIALGLRQLSLSGAMGNIIAIVLYGVFSLIPLVFLFKKNLKPEDWFLVILSLHLFFALYCMINPGLLSKKMPVALGAEFEKILLGGMFYSFLVGYLVIRLVRSFFAADRDRLVRYLHILLVAMCFLLVYLIFGSSLACLVDSIHALQTGNKGNEHLLGVSYVFLTLQYLIDVLPYVLDILIVIAVRRLLQAEQNSEEAVLSAERLSRLCGHSLMIIVVSHAVYHVLQLLFLRKVFYSTISIELPLFSLLFILTVLIAVQYIRENKQLQEDNDLFI